MAITNSLREVAIELKGDQVPFIDALLEDAPILASIPMEETNRGFQHIYEELKNGEGGQVIAIDGSLPSVNSTTTLKTKDLSVIAGEISVGEDTAKRFGGAGAYFGKKMPSILRQTGMDTEESIIYDNLRPYAKANGNEIDAGGTTANSMYSMVAVRWEPSETTGLYDPDGFGDGRVFDIEPMYNGALCEVKLDGTNAVPGYKQRMKAYFGIQLAKPRNVASIVNIDLTEDNTTSTGYKALPSEAMVRQLIRSVRGKPSNTKIYTHQAVIDAMQTYMSSALQVTPMNDEYNTVVIRWNGIEFVPSYNFKDGTESVVA